MTLGHDVGDTHHFKHRAHRAAGNNARTFGSWSHHDRSSTVVTKHLVVNGTVFKRHFGQVAARFFHGLLNSRRHLFRFALAHADAAIAITHHGERSKAQNTAAFHHFGDAVDRNHFFAQTVFRTLGPFALHFCLYFSHV